MSIVMSPLQRRIKAAATSLRDGAGMESLENQVRSLTARTLDAWGAMTPASNSGGLGLESLADVTAQRNTSFDSATDGDPAVLLQELQKLRMPERHQEGVTEACLNLMDRGYNSHDILRGGYTVAGVHADMSMVVGRTSAAGMSAIDSNLGQEAFGDDINRLNTDNRLSMSLVIMRPWENIMDKAFARVNESSPVVTIRVPLPEVYDWSATQRAGSTTQERSASTPLRDLYRNPTRVNTAAKKIVAIAANDTAEHLWKSTDVRYYKTGRNVPTLDLSRDTNKFGFHQVDRTDLVSDGGTLDSVLVTITDPSDSNRKETFLLNTRPFALAMFGTLPANKTSGQRGITMPCVLPISETTKQYDGSASVIAAKLTDAKILVKLMVNSTLNLQDGMLQASGSANKELVKKDGAAAISAQTNTLFGQLLVEFSAYSVDTYFDEENQRKANLAVHCNYREMQFVVPRSRVYFTEYSLTQDIDENAIQATSAVIALGNGRRGLDIVVNRMNDVSKGLEFIANNPEVAAVNAVDEQSFVSSLVKPSVVSTTLNFGEEELNVMNESTRLTEIHGRFRARVLSMVTQLMANSLMLNQYKGGETPVFKLFTHNTIADVVIGILDYHPDLDDRETKATGADYSMKLPNGYRLDVIKSNLDCLKGRIYGMPVMESDMASLLSAASIRDCGTVTTNYAPTNGGSVVRRVATTTREIVMMSNPVGFMIEVTGLDEQIGEAEYKQLVLNKDSDDTIGI